MGALYVQPAITLYERLLTFATKKYERIVTCLQPAAELYERIVTCLQHASELYERIVMYLQPAAELYERIHQNSRLYDEELLANLTEDDYKYSFDAAQLCDGQVLVLCVRARNHVIRAGITK